MIGAGDALTLGGPSGLIVEVLRYGAILRRISFPVRGARRELILGFDRLEEYVADRAYVGALVGRFGNRIANAAFTRGGRTHPLSANEGVNHLHGGHLGFGKRLWRVLEQSVDGTRATLAYTSPAGEEGYPGTLEAAVTLEVRDATLAITLTATCDAPTPVNLTYHPYFNLNGRHSAAVEQHLRIPATHYLPVRAGLIPDGTLAPVAGTPFDFRARRRLAPPPLDMHPQLAIAGGYDHCWALERDADCSCELISAAGDLALTMRGTGPGLQFYNGQFLARAHPQLASGVILEPQGFPDAPNQPQFPDSILVPGARYRATIEYRLHTA